MLGGYYDNGTLYTKTTRGSWWGSEANSGARRRYLDYNGSILNSGSYYRHLGRYIRCVSEEKAITSLTYIQDMTPAIDSG